MWWEMSITIVMGGCSVSLMRVASRRSMLLAVTSKKISPLSFNNKEAAEAPTT